MGAGYIEDRREEFNFASKKWMSTEKGFPGQGKAYVKSETMIMVINDHYFSITKPNQIHSPNIEAWLWILW